MTGFVVEKETKCCKTIQAASKTQTPFENNKKFLVACEKIIQKNDDSNSLVIVDRFAHMSAPLTGNKRRAVSPTDEDAAGPAPAAETDGMTMEAIQRHVDEASKLDVCWTIAMEGPPVPESDLLSTADRSAESEFAEETDCII
jgi:hypothetical protein